MIKQIIDKLRSHELEDSNEAVTIRFAGEEVSWLREFLERIFAARQKGGRNRYRNAKLSNDPADIRNREAVRRHRSKRLTK